MIDLLETLGGISLFILSIGVIVWFIRRRSTRRPFGQRTKKVMWASLVVLIIASIFSEPTTPASETAAKSEIQPLVEAEEPSESEAEAAKEKETKAEEAKLAEEKLAADKKAEDERIAAEKKAAEEKAAEEKLAQEKAAQEKAQADKLAAEEKAAAEKAEAERLALEQKAAEEKAAQEEAAAQQAAASTASSSASSENFSNCTELRTVYPSGVPEGHAAYQGKMDRDKDGYACET